MKLNWNNSDSIRLNLTQKPIFHDHNLFWTGPTTMFFLNKQQQNGTLSDATNLINGIGNAWAWHNKAKLCPVGLRKKFPKNSLWKVGARDPIGSVTRNNTIDSLINDIEDTLKCGIKVRKYFSFSQMFKKIIFLKPNWIIT